MTAAWNFGRRSLLMNHVHSSDALELMDLIPNRRRVIPMPLLHYHDMAGILTEGRLALGP